MKTKKPPTWQEWQEEMKSQKEAIRASISMIQAEARSILEAVTDAETTEQACEILKTRLPDRRHVTYWLGQIGRRGHVRLGQGKDFLAYITAVVERIRSRIETHVDKEGKTMSKREGKPIVVIKKGKPHATANESEGPCEVISAVLAEVAPAPTDNHLKDSTVIVAENVQEPETTDHPRENTFPEQEAPISRVQEYALRNLRVFADCAVQKDEEGIFHVLGRNFEDKPMLHFWLWKVGYGHLSRFIRNKDLLDSLRILSREIYRDMKETVGKPIPRW